MNGLSPMLLEFHAFFVWAAVICTIWLLSMLRISLTSARIDGELREDPRVVRRARLRALLLLTALAIAGGILAFDGWGIAALAATAALGALHANVVIRGSRPWAMVAVASIAGAALVELALSGWIAGSAVVTVAVLRMLIFLVDNHSSWRGTGYGNGGSHVRVDK